MSGPLWRSPRCCSSGINIFADNFFTDTRLDLTQTGQYTLSAGTRAIIAKLPEPVTLRFYFSKKNSADYPRHRRLCQAGARSSRRICRLSHGKIILEDVDPEPFTPEEDEANAAGIRPAPTDRRRRGLFRPGRHQQHRRQGSHSLFRDRARALSGI